MEEPKYQFDVFLSYSRKDEEFGKRLEEALESYTLPKAVSARALSRKRLNVFRDKKDLVPTDSDYYKSIEGYLKLSRYLIVVCSPNARSSEYVNQEIRTYLQSHEANQVIAVLLSGKPNNDTKAPPEDYAFPQALCDSMAMPLAVEFTDFVRAPGRLNKRRFTIHGIRCCLKSSAPSELKLSVSTRRDRPDGSPSLRRSHWRLSQFFPSHWYSQSFRANRPPVNAIMLNNCCTSQT